MPLDLQFVPLGLTTPTKLLKAFRRDAHWPTTLKALPQNPHGRALWISAQSQRQTIAIARLELAAPEFCLISDLIVHSKYRRRGVGRWLIERIEQYSNNLGIRRLILTPTDGSEEFYRALAFQNDPLVAGALKKDVNPLLPRMFLPI